MNRNSDRLPDVDFADPFQQPSIDVFPENGTINTFRHAFHRTTSQRAEGRRGSKRRKGHANRENERTERKKEMNALLEAAKERREKGPSTTPRIIKDRTEIRI